MQTENNIEEEFFCNFENKLKIDVAINKKSILLYVVITLSLLLSSNRLSLFFFRFFWYCVLRLIFVNIYPVELLRCCHAEVAKR